MIEDCTAIILAGGDSKRMGRDKANVPLGEQTLLQRVIAAMQIVFPRVIVSVREPRAEIDLMQICDEQARDGTWAGPLAGPLAGMLASLAEVTTPWAFVVACDMPFMQPSLIELLSQHRSRHQAVVPVIHGQMQPLASFYARDCLDTMRAHLAAGGKNSPRAVLEKLQVRYVDETELLQADPTLRSFFDLDTPQEVAQALQERAFSTG